MKIIHSKFLLIVLLFGTSVQAQNTPLIDRELFFGNPEIAGGQLSPDGKWISFMKEYDGIMNIWVKAFDEAFDKARPLTNSPRPLYGYFWTYDGKYILYVKDKDGDENINVYAVNPAERVEKGKLPESRNLTPMTEVQARITMVSRNNPDLLMIGLNDRDKAWHDLYSLKISTGELELVYENNDRIISYNFDWDDNLRLLYRTAENGNTTLLRVDGKNKLSPIYETNVDESAYVVGWNKDNSKCYLVTNKGDLNLSTLFLMDPLTVELTIMERDPHNRVDFGNLMLDRNTREIIGTSYTDDKTRFNWKDKTWESNFEFLKKKFPGREIRFQSSTNDYGKFLVATTGDRYASEAWFFDAKTRDLIHQYTPRPALKKVEEHLSEMKPVTYASSDGLEIPAYLTVPKGMEVNNLPLVVLVHGGPKGPRDYWGYDPEVQFLANRGYAVLQPNFRASGGYGKSFLNAGDKQWGKLMQDDITWGVKHFISQGIVDPNRVAIMGASYGGYAALAGLAFTPEVYACGISIVGPSNLFTLLESIPPYWEAARAYLHAMLGDPDTEEGRALIKEASPLFKAENIKKPLMIVQGANDPRVKKAESDQIVIALRDKGRQVSYIMADDEGHGFAKPVNRMAMYAETEKFLSGILGGRYQDEMPDNIVSRLEEMRVDINSVTYEAATEIEVATQLPAINNTFKAGTFKYEISLEVQGQTIPMTMTRTVAQIGENWLVKEETKGAMGEASDEITFTSTFTPVSREMSQMGQVITMTYGTDKVSLTVRGQQMEMPVKGAYISDGPGMDKIIAGLPLQKDYELSCEIPDMMTMKARQVVLKVIDLDEVNGINCWKVEVATTENPNDKTTLWINPETKLAEKTVRIIPAMNNAKMTVIRNNN